MWHYIHNLDEKRKFIIQVIEHATILISRYPSGDPFGSESPHICIDILELYSDG